MISQEPGFDRICSFYENSAIDINNVHPLQNIISGRYIMESEASPTKKITISRNGGTDLLGIYKFEGPQLWIAYRAGGPRPEKFESTPGSGITLMVLETSKPRTTNRTSGPSAVGFRDVSLQAGQKSNVEVVQNGQPAPKGNRPAGVSAESRPLAFAPVTWKEITTQDCDAQGLVFFDMETGKSLKPPFALKLTNRAPDIVELTPELKEWIKANDVDILFHLGSKTWEKMRLEMQEDVVGQPNEWETIKPETVLGHFAKKDAAGIVRNDLPGTSSGMGYRGDWSSCQAFRTRTNTRGLFQDEGFENTSVRGVRLRYKVVQ